MQAIGIFDSGYGGLTVFDAIQKELPQYDYLYLGDNARAPYGNRSFKTVYHYTLECVKWMLQQGCPLIILACNTASAKALRTIQQNDLSKNNNARILGVIRPTAQVVGNYTQTKHVGVLGTKGTIDSQSYPIEIQHHFPEVTVYQQACPLWVPLVENNLLEDKATIHIVNKDLNALFAQSLKIDTVLLACTHYPLLAAAIRKGILPHVKLLSQGAIVAQSLKDYLNRHPEITSRITQKQRQVFYTTDNPDDFEQNTSLFINRTVEAQATTLK